MASEGLGLGLLGAYGSSSSDEDDDGSGEEEKKADPAPAQVAPPAPRALTNPFKDSSSSLLPKPSFMVEARDFTAAAASTSAPKPDQSSSSSAQASVFSNPFKRAEDEKRAVLERHVAMTSRQEEQKTIGGKKVCYNFRKGRCRFGHNCTFAHDSDIGLKKAGHAEDTNDDPAKQQQHLPSSSSRAPAAQPLPTADAADPEYDDGAVISAEDTQGLAKKRKKRPGLADGLSLGKKAMKFHQKVYNNSSSSNSNV